MDPNGHTIYMADPVPSGSNSIVPVNTSTGIIGAPIPVPGLPIDLAISPDGKIAYVCTQGGANITPVTLATGSIGKLIPVPKGVTELAIAPGGRVGYAIGNTNAVIGKQTFSYVTPINLVTGVAESAIALRHFPNGIAISPDGRMAYVAGGIASGSPAPPDVTSINLTTGRVGGTYAIPGGAANIVNAAS